MQARFDDHFRSELHSGAALIETIVEIFSETSHPAVDIMKRRFEPPPGKKGKHRIAPNAVEKRHRSRHDSASARWKTAALDNIESLPECADEFRDFEKIIAIVCISHNDEFAASGSYSLHQSISISTLLYMKNSNTQALRNFTAAIRASVIRNDDFAINLMLVQGLGRLFYADR
jgi:hypothetical protein